MVKSKLIDMVNVFYSNAFTGPPGIRITEVEKDIIRLIAKTTDEISTIG